MYALFPKVIIFHPPIRRSVHQWNGFWVVVPALCPVRDLMNKLSPLVRELLCWFVGTPAALIRQHVMPPHIYNAIPFLALRSLVRPLGSLPRPSPGEPLNDSGEPLNDNGDRADYLLLVLYIFPFSA